MATFPEIITPRDYGGQAQSFPGVTTAPGPLMDDGDKLIVRCTTSNATGSIEINGRLLRFDGETVFFREALTFSGTGTQAVMVAGMAGGWLIGFDLHRLTGTLTDGQVVASVHLSRNEGSLQTQGICLASGEVTDIRSLGLGAFTIVGSSTLTIPAPTLGTATSAPAAGAEFSMTVTAAQVWQIISINALLTTDGTAASRVVELIIDDGTNILQRVRWISTQVASLAYTYGWNDCGSTVNGQSSLVNLMPIGSPLVGAGYRIRSSTTNLQAADAWTLVRMSYRLYT